MTPEQREAWAVLLRVMQDEGIVGRKRQRIEDAAQGIALALAAAPSDDDLGAAWREAEEALGPQFKDLTLRQQYDGRYLAGTSARRGLGGISGPTPAAALRALAARLREA